MDGSAHRPGGLRPTRATGGRAHRSATSSTAIPDALRVSGTQGYTSQVAVLDLDEVSPLFLPAVFYGSGGEPAGSDVIADVNGDGKPDLIVADDCAIRNSILLA